MYSDESGDMPKWAKKLVGGLAITGLVAAAVMTCFFSGTIIATVGAAMLTGGLVSGGIDVLDQLSDNGEVDWTQVAISTLAGEAYGLVVGITGGAGGWAVAGKLAVAGGESLLTSWNQNETFSETMISLGGSLLISGAVQLAGKYVPQIKSKFESKDNNDFKKIPNIISKLWKIPSVKTGVIRFTRGVFLSISNNF